MDQDLSLAVWQCPYAAHSAEALLLLDATAAQARAQGANLLVCPEMSLTGYQIGAAGVATCAEPADGALAQAVAGIARQHGIAIAYGYPEHHADGKPFNAAQFIDEHGQRRANYRKTHLFGDVDRSQFSVGPQAPAVFGWRGWQLGLLICYDIEFPEPTRALALQGAELLLVPTANMVEYDEVQQVLLPARALENRVYLAYADACGSEGSTTYGGLSTVCDPMGRVLVRSARTEALEVVTLSRCALRNARDSAQLKDRRPGLYETLSR